MPESKGPTGAGIQHTGKGPVQGITLVASDGRPYDLVIDNSGKRRLAVDSTMNFSGSITIDLDANTDSVAIGNAVGGDTLLINGDGSINNRLHDGAGNPITSDARGGSTRAVAVEIVDAAGNQITSFGASTVDVAHSSIPGLAIPVHDTILLSYTGVDLTGVVYKLAGITVATLTLIYASHVLQTVVKS